MYYLRSKAASEAIKFTVTQNVKKHPANEVKALKEEQELICSLEEGCVSCSG
jgi:hypothetical protein